MKQKKGTAMKYLNKIYSFLIISSLLMIISCVKNEYDLLDSAKLGFRLTMTADSYLEATYDISSKELTYDSTYVSVQYEIPELTSDFSVIELHKIIKDQDEIEVDDYIYATFQKADLPVDTLYTTSDTDELYEGLTFPKDSLKPGYTIEFRSVMKMNDGSELIYLYGSYSIVPVLNGFCPLPDLPSGLWTAVNNNTMFSKTVTIMTPSPFVDVDDGRYWLSDFGLDWSTWHDLWYSIEFKLDCPKGSDPRYVVNLLPGGNWDTGEDWTAIDHTGTEATKHIRIMPYQYEDPNIVGHYDPDTQKLTFEDVPVLDSWWNTDNHTVNLTFTFKETL